MPLEMADIEDLTLENLAVLKHSGRDMLCDEALVDVRSAVDAMVSNLEKGLTPSGVSKAQNRRVSRGTRKGARVMCSVPSCVVKSRDGSETIIDPLGRVFQYTPTD